MSDLYFNQTIEALKKLPQIDCITLGGSRATMNHDTDSDYDVYVYLNQPIAVQERRQILSATCQYMELDNQYWETEDDCVLKDGITIELIYRTVEDIDQSLYHVLNCYSASTGYTTCLCYNVFQAKVLFDPVKKYEDMVQKYSFAYPPRLQKNIIQKNRELLDGKIPSYSQQIAKAIKRSDLVSINHRVSAFLASYFDIIFAINNMYHPGEKQLISYCKANCKILPSRFQENLELLLTPSHAEDTMTQINGMIKNLDKLIK